MILNLASFAFNSKDIESLLKVINVGLESIFALISWFSSF